MEAVIGYRPLTDPGRRRQPSSMQRPHPELTEALRRELRNTLEAERQSLGRQVERARTRGAVTLDQTAVGRLSRMDALMNEGLSQGSEARAAEDLNLVEDALARLDAGTYGFCHSCDRPIPVDRLLVIPEARDCASCRR